MYLIQEDIILLLARIRNCKIQTKRISHRSYRLQNLFHISMNKSCRELHPFYADLHAFKAFVYPHILESFPS